MSTLHPCLSVVAARLEAGNAAKVADEGPLPALQADGATAAAGTDWAALPIPPALAAAFERSAQARSLRTLALAPGQFRALRHAPAFGAVLLDRWSPAGQCWQGWLATPDPAYAGSMDMVLEQGDDPLDPRLGMVCCAMRVQARADQLGACLGVLAAERMAMVRWLGEWDRGAAAGNLARPGVVARAEVPGGYALIGSPLAGPDDPRHAYRGLLARGIASFGLEVALPVPQPVPQPVTQLVTQPAARGGQPDGAQDTTASTAGSSGGRKERPMPHPPAAPAGPASGGRWVKPFAALAAALAILQSGLLLWRYHSDGATPAAAPRAPGAGGNDIRAQFRPEATEAEIRAWLLRQGLQIVGGPDTAGSFMLHADDGRQALPAPGPGNPLARPNP